jgi:hypothetical protein
MESNSHEKKRMEKNAGKQKRVGSCGKYPQIPLKVITQRM